MTIEETFSRDARVPDLGVDMTETGWDVAAVQLAVADAARVTLPQGQRIIVVPVTPGETVELPVDSAQGLLAELGPQGNLAFVIDGRTIILQGYAAANDQSPVTIVTNDGERIDVAAVVAETDPSIDIQTAAGPAAGPQGDGADGSGIFVPFPAGAPLGGFSGEGVLGATDLQYKLITDETKIFDFDDDDDEDELGGIENSLPEANPDSATVTEATAANYQLMLVIDVSGSMDDPVTRPDGTVTTRMELQKAAVITMLESYAAAADGSVNIKMVQFSNSASYFGGTSASTFVDITNPANLAAVIAAITALSPTDNTDYDTALATAQLGIMDASWATTSATTKGLVYFFSDGKPTPDGDAGGLFPDPASSYPGGDKANSVDQVEENIWEGRTSAAGFATGLADKGVVSIAVGLGADIAGDPAAVQQLERVAYKNETFPDQPVIAVNDENQLNAELIETVPATVTGNVLTNDDPGADGYGDPHIIAVSAIIDADTTSQIVTETAIGYKVETNNGILTIDKTTGDFAYTAAPGSGGHADAFTYTIQDGFLSDTDSATLTINIAPPTMALATAPFDGTSSLDSQVEDIETIRTNGGAGTSVTLDANDVITDLEGGSFNPDGAGGGGNYDNAPVMRVDGDAGDTLNLSGSGWFEATDSSGVPAGYTLYVHEAGGGAPGAAEDAYVLAQNGMTVTGV